MTRPENERRGSRLSDEKHRLGQDRRACRQTIERVLAECVDKSGFEPHNLVYWWHQLRPSGSEEVLEEAVRTLKGYFVWESHVVTATKAEIRLMRGHRAVRSDTFDSVWSPMKLLDGSPTWQDEPHVVVLGDEVFSVARATKVQTPSAL